jgi:hypothetical protein
MLEGTRWCAVLLCACAAATGGAACGGDDKDAEGKEEAPSVASESPQAFVTRVAKLLETTRVRRECADIELINDRSVPKFPCPPEKGLSESMASFKVTSAKEYGTGALVEYTSGVSTDGATIMLLATPDRQWGIGRFGISSDTTPAEPADIRAGFDKAVTGYLAAIRKRSCKDFIKASLVGDATAKQVCPTLFARTEGIAKRLKRDPSARPAYEGGDGTFAFYTLETAKPKAENTTISLVRSGKGAKMDYLVLDQAPAPTAAAQRKPPPPTPSQPKPPSPDDVERSPSKKAS